MQAQMEKQTSKSNNNKKPHTAFQKSYISTAHAWGSGERTDFPSPKTWVWSLSASRPLSEETRQARAVLSSTKREYWPSRRKSGQSPAFPAPCHFTNLLLNQFTGLSEFIFLQQCNGEICCNSKRDCQWELFHFAVIISFSKENRIQKEHQLIFENFPPFKKKLSRVPGFQHFEVFQHT